jgi:hypothetical protein
MGVEPPHPEPPLSPFAKSVKLSSPMRRADAVGPELDAEGPELDDAPEELAPELDPSSRLRSSGSGTVQPDRTASAAERAMAWRETR